MKAAFFARALTTLFAVPILILIQAPSGSAEVEAKVTGDPSAAISCTNKAKFFPTSIYTKFKFGPADAFSGFEVRLSNNKGDCSATLYSSGTIKK